MLTVMQEHQHPRVLKNEESQRVEENPRHITYLRDKRVLMKQRVRRL